MFSYRSIESIGFADNIQKETKTIFQYPKDTSSSTKFSSFSPDGSLYAWITPDGLSIFDVEANKLLNTLPLKKVLEYAFSPKGTFVSTFERLLKTEDGQPQHLNVNIWEARSGQKLTSFTHKNPETWKIQWTEDEGHFGRLVTNQVQFHDRRNHGQVCAKLQLEGIAGFSVSPGKNPSVAVFVPERKGSPAIVRLYGMLSFNFPLSNKSFYKADEVEFNWNPIGTNVLVLTRTAIDKTGQSYYGETNLYYLSAVGNYDCRVALDKTGPVHEIAWNPAGNEFVVVYGNVPARAAVFDSRANKAFDFGESPKNFVRISPRGRLILLAGFGNLAGQVDIWDRKNLIKVCSYQEELAVYCEFMPDGLSILTATLSPRLRVDNRFRVRNYKGEILWQKDFKELFSVAIRPGQFGGLEEDTAVFEVQSTSSAKQQPKAAYVPPHLRKSRPGAAAANGGTQNTSSNVTGTKTSSNETRTGGAVAASLKDSGNEKKIMAVNRKLRQIEQLKERQAKGEQLEQNQLNKISSEKELLEELRQLQLK